MSEERLGTCNLDGSGLMFTHRRPHTKYVTCVGWRPLPVLEPSTPEVETAWLLEKEIDGRPHWIGVMEFQLGWTDNPNKALRLARRADGEALAEICEDADRITEHQWVSK